MKAGWVLAGLFALSLITYIDRAAISSVKDDFARELSFTSQQTGAVFSAFALGYALAQIPAGMAADRFGARFMLTAVVALWSVLTALTGAVSTFTAMLAVRFLFGLAEAGAYPGAARAIHDCMPKERHGRAHGIMFAASRLGAAGAFPLMAWLLARASWRTAFFWLALPGAAWGAMWYWRYRAPRRDAAVVAARIPWSGKLGLAMAQYFGTNLTTFFCLSWMNPYLKERYQLTAAEAASYTMAAMLVAASAQWLSGSIVDRLYGESRWRAWSRRGPAMAGFAIAAVGILLVPRAATPVAATVFFAIATFGVEMTIPASWAFCLDLGGAQSGAVTGAMNMMGNIGSFVSANAFPYLGSAAYFPFVAAANIGAAVCWVFMRKDE